MFGLDFRVGVRIARSKQITSKSTGGHRFSPKTGTLLSVLRTFPLTGESPHRLWKGGRNVYCCTNYGSRGLVNRLHEVNLRFTPRFTRRFAPRPTRRFGHATRAIYPAFHAAIRAAPCAAPLRDCKSNLFFKNPPWQNRQKRGALLRGFFRNIY